MPIIVKKSLTPSNFEHINDNELHEVLNNLKNNKACEFDGIITNLIKENKATLVPILKKLINNVLDEGIYPQCMKNTIIKPIFKSGDTTKAENYRPIALLSTLSKILEKVIQIRLLRHIEVHNLMARQQYAYQEKRGTLPAAVDLLQEIKLNRSLGKVVTVIFIDLKKAFDTISRDKLVEKLHVYNITGTDLNLIKTYLNNRQQTTTLEKTVSTPTMTKKFGIPQGGIIPPNLFNLYINDLSDLELHGTLYSVYVCG